MHFAPLPCPHPQHDLRLQGGSGTAPAGSGCIHGADVTAERFAPELEASGYFIVAEALTNVVKHVNAISARVSATVEDGALRIEVRDDGDDALARIPPRAEPHDQSAR